MSVSIEIVELWCNECGGDVPFEVVPVDSPGAAREWACVACGAAYIEAFHDVSEIDAGVRGVA